MSLVSCEFLSRQLHSIEPSNETTSNKCHVLAMTDVRFSNVVSYSIARYAMDGVIQDEKGALSPTVQTASSSIAPAVG